VDLQDLARRHNFRVGSLNGLCCVILGFRMSKRQRMSNWERQNLTEDQIFYAATDAWVSRELALKLLDDEFG
jgi:ribonuclease D